MTKLLIIDDEAEIREGIRSSIDWEGNDIYTYEAASGMEALDIINKTFPDILLVDIRMPVMNGLQIIESVSMIHPYIKSIILSGYDDFSYAKKALKLGAVDYLLKPCRPNEILSSVINAKKLLEKETKQRKTLMRYENELYMSLPLIKRNYLINLIQNTGLSSDASFMNKFSLLHFNICKSSLIAIVMKIDSYAKLISTLRSRDLEIYKYGVLNIAQEIFSQKYNCEIFQYNDDIVAILNIREEALTFDIIESIKLKVLSSFSFTISIGIGNLVKDIEDISSSYKQALSALEFKFFKGNNSTIYYRDIKSICENNKYYPFKKETQIMDLIKSGDKEKLKDEFNAFFDLLIEKSLAKDQILKASMTLLVSACHLMFKNNSDENIMIDQIDELDKYSKFENIKELQSNILKTLNYIMDSLQKGNVGNKLINEAIKFINENYQKDIDLETIGKSIFISPSYVSFLFKHVLGVNFVDYLHQVRLKKACELLKSSQLKNYEIAYMIGYNDEKYFSQIFKKYLGLTPSQYRKSII